ncbi:MAG: Uma2 family endonuclease, partial [Cyanobacteria bacterium P01_H01_bin.121]
AMDPAPDLAIEVEVPSFTNINDYLPFAIPEIWLIRANEIVIHSLGSECYFPVTSSQFLPDVDVAGVYSQVLTAVKSGDSYWRAIRQVIG